MEGQQGYQPSNEHGFSQGGFKVASEDSQQSGFQSTKNHDSGFTEGGFKPGTEFKPIHSDDSGFMQAGFLPQPQTEKGFSQGGFQQTGFTQGGFQDTSDQQQKGFQPVGSQTISVDTADVQTLKDALAQVSTALEKANAIIYKLEFTPARNADPGSTSRV